MASISTPYVPSVLPNSRLLQTQFRLTYAGAGINSSPSSLFRSPAVALAFSGHRVASSSQFRIGSYTVGDFMTKKGNLQVLKPSTSVDEALEVLVEKSLSGFPVVDDDWKLVGVVSDYDLLALDSISGVGDVEANIFPDVNSSWKSFKLIQKLLSKKNGEVVGDLMTPAPLVVRETMNLESAARLLLETKFHLLPVVDCEGKLMGIITREDIVRAGLQMKRTHSKELI
ncbi:CBS domain-containing protein CBSX1, chloroplastic-like [Benincasa hispida]|uniref:CBS domain-containing protein CBSX1, chloroplastic-like n=1 Tax=Benincasa hispida TaxID=102211 RepID=UPI00190132F7|nr:CBS domain-containing protein CBSX1, chloroplastic-like [Benincasa hispida]